MSQSPLCYKVLKSVSSKLWSTILLEDVRYHSVTKHLLQCCDEMVCHVLANWNNLWPFSEAVYRDEELFTSIATAVVCNFLKTSKRFRFLY